MGTAFVMFVLGGGSAVAITTMRSKGKEWKRDEVLPNLFGRVDEGDDSLWRWGLRSGMDSAARSQVRGWKTTHEATVVFEALFPGVPYRVLHKE